MKKVFKYYKYNDCPAEVDVPDQAYAIVEILKEQKKELERDQLVKLLKLRLKTSQSPSRILSYYQRVRVDNGCITIRRRT